MLNIQTNYIQGYKEREIPFTMIRKRKESKNLAVLLPGAGYTVKAPLLHYTTSLFLNHSFDVLQVNYTYNDYSMEEIKEAIKYDVNAVLDCILADHSYDDSYIIAKSLGTIAMNSVLERADMKNTKAIWMTPLIQREDVLGEMVKSEHMGLCFIGDKDPVFNEVRYAKVVKNTYIRSQLIPNVNHGLEYEEDTIGSIDVLRSIMSDLEDFL
ncbi:alpha/beta hydrolase [Bacillus sp. 1P06AnD]|uniref:alpha/beta hydrolase n=1 Tax=Bacillus sp. 1P06AnD TaxID=3132208 RepID=UPI00399F3BD2